MRRKTISLITYSGITKDDSKYYVNRADGMLLDAISPFFDKVYYIASLPANSSSLYENGVSIYTYNIKSNNVMLVKINSVGYLSITSAEFKIKWEFCLGK